MEGAEQLELTVRHKSKQGKEKVLATAVVSLSPIGDRTAAAHQPPLCTRSTCTS